MYLPKIIFRRTNKRRIVDDRPVCLHNLVIALAYSGHDVIRFIEDDMKVAFHLQPIAAEIFGVIIL